MVVPSQEWLYFPKRSAPSQGTSYFNHSVHDQTIPALTARPWMNEFSRIFLLSMTGCENATTTRRKVVQTSRLADPSRKEPGSIVLPGSLNTHLLFELYFGLLFSIFYGFGHWNSVKNHPIHGGSEHTLDN